MRVEARERSESRPRGRGSRLSAAQVLVLGLTLLASMAAGYLGYQRVSQPAAPATTATTVPVRRGTITATANLAGSVATISQAKVAFESVGRLAQLLVKEGSSVKKGDILGKLDTAQLELQVAQAEVTLEREKAKLTQLKEGPKAVEVAAARASYDSAVTKYEEVKSIPKPEDVATAEAAVRDAEAALANAQPNLVLVQKSATVSKNVRDRENEHNWYEVRYGETLAKFNKREASQSDLDRDWSNLMTAKERLDSARAEAELALRGAENSVAKAEENLRKARENHQKVLAGATPEQLKSAEAAMLNAKAQLEAKTAGPSETDIFAQEVAVRLAEATLKQQQLLLKQATLVAPFDGVIDAVNINVGEQVSSAGQQVMTLVNLERFRIDARVDETDVSRLAVGQTTAVTIDALPDQRLTAKVSFIAANPVTQQGVVSYPVVLELEPSRAPVRPGMTANLAVEVDRRENVLLVPNRAVRTQGRSRMVEVSSAGTPESRPITVGLSNDQFTEVTGGVQEGEEVVIPTTTTTAPRAPGAGGFGGIGVPGVAPASKPGGR